MPGFPPGRPGGEHDEPLLDMIIARRALPPDAPQPMHDLARMLAALAGPAEPGELAGEAAVRAAFSRAASPAGISSAARRPGRRRRPRRPARSRARLATALVVAVAGLGSVLAAYTDVLPGPVQQLAHVTVAAPAPPSSGRQSSAKASALQAAPATLQPSSRPAPGPHHSAGLAQVPGQGKSPQPSYKPARDQVARSSSHRAGLQPEPVALAQSAADGVGASEPALVVPGGALHRHPERAGGPAHPGPVRSLATAQSP